MMRKINNFNMEKVSVTGFCIFCRNNIPLVLAVSITLFFTYGIRLFWYSIGVDTELFMTDREGMLNWSVQIGRFGFALLSKLWHIKEFNPFTAFFSAFCSIWFFTISWCYIIAIFSRETVKNHKLIPFALVLMTSPVWAEQFYFLLQAAETSLMISLCPYVIYLLYKGFLDGENGKIVCVFVLLVFMVSVYQAIVPFFCCGVFACFILLQEHSGFEPAVYRKLCLQLFVTLIGALALYFFIDGIIIPYGFHVEKADYLDNMNQWGQRPLKKNILDILRFGYTITVGHIPLFQNIVKPIIENNARTGMAAVENIFNTSRHLGNVLLLPGAVFFLIGISVSMRKIIPAGRRILYMLAGIGVPLSIFFLALMGGTSPTLRALYALPLASAFMFFYLIKIYRKKAAFIIASLVVLSAAYQAQITAQLFYSDQVRYNEDVSLAVELDKLITRVQPDNERLPVALVGRYESASRLSPNFLEGEVIGHSVFGWSNHQKDTTTRGLAFMNSLGIYFDIPDDNQLDQALDETKTMPAYPDPACVKRMENCIVVRIFDTLYDKYNQ
jgi:hypothetical protein